MQLAVAAEMQGWIGWLLPGRTSQCIPAVFYVTENLKTGVQTPLMDFLVAMEPNWPTLSLPCPRHCYAKHQDESSLMLCPRFHSPCWERCLCGSVKVAARVWKRKRGGAPKSNLHLCHCLTHPHVSPRAVGMVTQSRVQWIGTPVLFCRHTNCQDFGTPLTAMEGISATTTVHSTPNKDQV